ncbi:hypothetical protein LBWT_X1380 (plasmid) [Leptolyngbya boryana IAM M-101]|nr:hypothetical protein LBWT_X1380 [Leptolyngbya boryana IAM M-101]BAS66414.1 hypothetical protein LBDG_X1380 [Leptolyngbya boryana dg5]
MLVDNDCLVHLQIVQFVLAIAGDKHLSLHLALKGNHRSHHFRLHHSFIPSTLQFKHIKL